MEAAQATAQKPELEHSAPEQEVVELTLEETATCLRYYTLVALVQQMRPAGRNGEKVWNMMQLIACMSPTLKPIDQATRCEIARLHQLLRRVHFAPNLCEAMRLIQEEQLPLNMIYGGRRTIGAYYHAFKLVLYSKIRSDLRPHMMRATLPLDQ